MMITQMEITTNSHHEKIWSCVIINIWGERKREMKKEIIKYMEKKCALTPYTKINYVYDDVL